MSKIKSVQNKKKGAPLGLLLPLLATAIAGCNQLKKLDGAFKFQLPTPPRSAARPSPSPTTAPASAPSLVQNRNISAQEIARVLPFNLNAKGIASRCKRELNQIIAEFKIVRSTFASPTFKNTVLPLESVLAHLDEKLRARQVLSLIRSGDEIKTCQMALEDLKAEIKNEIIASHFLEKINDVDLSRSDEEKSVLESLIQGMSIDRISEAPSETPGEAKEIFLQKNIVSELITRYQELLDLRITPKTDVTLWNSSATVYQIESAPNDHAELIIDLNCELSQSSARFYPLVIAGRNKKRPLGIVLGHLGPKIDGSEARALGIAVAQAIHHSLARGLLYESMSPMYSMGKLAIAPSQGMFEWAWKRMQSQTGISDAQDPGTVQLNSMNIIDELIENIENSRSIPRVDFKNLLENMNLSNWENKLKSFVTQPETTVVPAAASDRRNPP